MELNKNTLKFNIGGKEVSLYDILSIEYRSKDIKIPIGSSYSNTWKGTETDTLYSNDIVLSPRSITLINGVRNDVECEEVLTTFYPVKFGLTYVKQYFIDSEGNRVSFKEHLNAKDIPNHTQNEGEYEEQDYVIEGILDTEYLEYLVLNHSTVLKK